ncbi:MAG: hypothetical protein ACTHJ2_05540 [Candidatus Nitrosocosmicus sp.]
MSKDLIKNNYVIKPFIVSAILFIFVGSLIGSIWFAFILKINIPFFNGAIFNLHSIFQIESGLTLLIMGIGFMIVPRFRNTPIGSIRIIKISFMSILISTLLVIISTTINIFASIINEDIVSIAEIIRIIGIVLFVIKIFISLKIPPKLLRTADYFIGFSSICLLMLSMLDLFKIIGDGLLDIEIHLLFPIIMIFGIEYKTLPSFMGFVRPKKRAGLLSLIFLIVTFIVGISSKAYINNDTTLPILFNSFMIFSSILFSISVYVYSNYENKKYILRSSPDKRERYLYTLYHTRASFYFLYIGIALGLLYYVFDKKFIFYDLSIHFIAIGFIGITIASYLPMMLAPLLGRPIVIKKFNKIPIILIITSLIIRAIGISYISYFNGYDLFPLHVLTTMSGFLILLALIIFILLMYKSIKSKPQNSINVS